MVSESDFIDLSIVVPFKDKSELTIPCIKSIIQYGPSVKEILLVSNNSTDKTTAEIRKLIQPHPNITLHIYDVPFNFQKINNWAISRSTGSVVMMLNNDIELLPNSVGLLEHMYKLAQKKDVGAVGCVLLYEDKRSIQHAGVYLVPGGTADHLYIGKNYEKTISKIIDDEKYFDIRKDSQVSAVTAAAVMIERKKFDKVSGMNEHFIICGGDVDLCLRLNKEGYKSVLAGSDNGYMIHKESKSRSMISVPYVDFTESYRSYVSNYDISKGDPYISKELLDYVQ